MKAVNLIPADRPGAQTGPVLGSLVSQPLLIGAVVVAVGVAAAMFLAVSSTDKTITKRQAQVAQLDEQLAKLAAEKPAPVAQSGSTAASRLSTVTTVASERNSWDAFLGSVSRVLPEDVWLLSLQAQLPETPTAPAAPPAASAAPAAASGFSITGYTYSHPSVARLMRRLSLVPWLSDVSLVSSAKTAIANHTIYQFTVGANVVSLPEVGQ
jgi:Tfp pilus assembly protein PilN